MMLTLAGTTLRSRQQMFPSKAKNVKCQTVSFSYFDPEVFAEIYKEVSDLLLSTRCLGYLVRQKPKSELKTLMICSFNHL